MNPNTSIRPWILACGKQFGVRYAYEYRWPDKDNKPAEKFCTYFIQSSRPEEAPSLKYDTKSGNDVTQKGSKSYITTVIIEIHNSQNGIHELNSLCVALENHASIDALFPYATYIDSQTEDRSDYDDEEINRMQQLTVIFRETVSHTLTDANGAVETIRLQIDADSDQYDIRTTPGDPGFAPTT